MNAIDDALDTSDALRLAESVEDILRTRPASKW